MLLNVPSIPLAVARTARGTGERELTISSCIGIGLMPERPMLKSESAANASALIGDTPVDSRPSVSVVVYGWVRRCSFLDAPLVPAAPAFGGAPPSSWSCDLRFRFFVLLAALVGAAGAAAGSALFAVFEADAGGESTARVPSRCTRRRMVEFQWFLIALSVRPGRRLAISAHLLPRSECASRMIRSSSSVHGVFLIAGLRWLYHLRGGKRGNVSPK